MGLLTVSPSVIAEAQRRIRAQAAAAGADPNAIIFGLPPPKAAPVPPPPPVIVTAPPLPKLDDMVIPDSIISTPALDIASVAVQTPLTDAPRVVYSADTLFPTYGENPRTNAGDSGSWPREGRREPREEVEGSQGWESREAWQQARAVHIEKGGTEESFEAEHQKALAKKAKPRAKRNPRAKAKAQTAKAKRKRKPTAKRKPKRKTSRR